jgi:hypothetical protein
MWRRCSGASKPHIDPSRGLGGAGKTTLVQHYVRLYGGTMYSRGVLWLGAENAAQLRDEYRRVAVEQLGWADGAMTADTSLRSTQRP